MEEDLRNFKDPANAVGTTRAGIGPAYADRYGRWGIRMVDLVHPADLRQQLDLLYASKSFLPNPPPRDELEAALRDVGSRLAMHVRPTEPMLWNAITEGYSILLEGAQSALLDVDFGTYPYVTSSHPTAAGALVGSGIPPSELDEVLGVAKAYATRVGAGPFPTEVGGELGEFLQREGDERGATTGGPVDAAGSTSCCSDTFPGSMGSPPSRLPRRTCSAGSTRSRSVRGIGWIRGRRSPTIPPSKRVTMRR